MPTKLRRVRIEKNFSKRALSRAVGCAHPSIARWESAAVYPQPRLAKRLEDVLGVPAAQLLEVEEPTASEDDGLSSKGVPTKEHDATVKSHVR